MLLTPNFSYNSRSILLVFEFFSPLIPINIADPAKDIIKLSREEFEMHWFTTVENGERKGAVLLYEKSPLFEEMDATDAADQRKDKN